MEETPFILVVSLIVFLYGLFSKKLETLNISGPMIFLIVGVIVSPLGFDIANLSIDANIVKNIAEIALVLVLFTDSASINIKTFKHKWKVSARLLTIGLPLTIVFSTYSATFFFPSESLVNLLLMALILAPTDAALGKAVVLDKAIPEKIRQNINVESGLNDGIVFPMIITTILIISSHQELGEQNDWMIFLVKQISLGLIFGALTGMIGGKFLSFVVQKHWISDAYRNLAPVSLALLSCYIAEFFGGNGFISAFVAGMFFGNYSKLIDAKSEVFLESEGEVLILISFTIFGLTFIPETIDHWNLDILLYSLCSLTVFRMLPVALSLIGLKLSLASKLFIGWFGPRGIASILYIMIVAHKIEDVNGHETLYSVVTLTILLSIILHGLSAKPLVKLYANYIKDKEA
ncbi:cation:proton antiporter [Sulfurimonas sp. MAG313]|nr:cation:proton antiporter [Sulfurimonas sp. MAG313]MDF1880038.1 cation:proton antiporter [Sulfurimonas sp. MAG313]